MEEQPPRGDGEPDPLTSGDPLDQGGEPTPAPGPGEAPVDKGPALPEPETTEPVPGPPADKGPALPEEPPAPGPFVGGPSAPFGEAIQDEPTPSSPAAPEPAEPAPAAGPGGWIPEGSPVVGGPAEPEPPAPPAPPAPGPAFEPPVSEGAPAEPPPPPPAEPPGAAGPGGWVPEDSPVFGGGEAPAGEPVAPPPVPPSEPSAPSTPAPEPPSPPGMEAAPPTGLSAGDPLAASSEPAPSGFPGPPAAPGATGQETMPRTEGSIPPPGYTPTTSAYGGGPVPPGAYAPPAPAPQPIGNYQLASWGSRALALIIDSLIVGVASVILFIIIGAIFGGLGSLGGDNGGAVGFVIGIFIALLPVIIVSLLYKPYWMSKNDGATIGKQVMNIKVIRVNGQPTDFGWSALREVVVIQGLFGFVGGAFLLGIPIIIDYLWPLWDEENRALHDMLVQSRVVKA